jgi:hypothetical protein
MPTFDSQQGKKKFLYSTASIPSLWPTQPPINRILEALSSGVEADH